MMGKLGKATAKILRTGTKGISHQFRDQTEYRGAQSIPWERTKPFGTKKAPRKTMLGTKRYRTAWLGGAGSIETIDANTVTIGVDRGAFPQVAVHQSAKPFTLIRPKRKTKSGHWAMQFFLGLTYGVWLTNARLEKGLKVPRRRLSVSDDVKKEVAAMFRGVVMKSRGVKAQGPKELAA